MSMSESRQHIIVKNLVRNWMMEVFSPDWVETNSPVENLGTDQPPDLILLKEETASYQKTLLPADIDLVIEIADDSTLDVDLGHKPSLYARQGINEYWVINMLAKRLVVHRNAQNGRYNEVIDLIEGAMITPLVDSDAIFRFELPAITLSVIAGIS